MLAIGAEAAASIATIGCGGPQSSAGGTPSGGATGDAASAPGTSGNGGGGAGGGAGDASSTSTGGGGSRAAGGAATDSGEAGASESGDAGAGSAPGVGPTGAGPDDGSSVSSSDGGAAGPPVDCLTPSASSDLFVDLLGKSQADVDAKVAAAFQSLFHGGSNAAVYNPVGTDLAYILDVADDDVRSEGMSYGMMISVELDHQDEFDRLWSWAKKYMFYSSGPLAGYFAWHRDSSGNAIVPADASAPTVTNPAPDGEEYFATALIFASRRWGDGTGIFDYSSEARALLDTMVHKGESPDAEDAGVFSMFDPTAKMVVFVPSAMSHGFTDPSYHVPAFYETWACFDTKNAAFWKTVAATSRSFFPAATNATTGLAPEYAEFDGTPSTRQDKGDFRFDAWRVAMNVMADHRYYGVDPWQTTYASRLGGFFQSQGMYNDEYTLTGTSLDSDHSAGLVAMNATLGFALSASAAKPFVQELWDLAVPTGQFRYYDGMLYLLGLLHTSGKFQFFAR